MQLSKLNYFSFLQPVGLLLIMNFGFEMQEVTRKAETKLKMTAFFTHMQ